jgi:cytidine deaminase
MAQIEDSQWSRERLITAARIAARQAYAPYSRFRVGAVVVVETSNGLRMVSGANVENASYGLALCAERSALASACALESASRPDGAPLRMMGAPRITHVAVACLDAPEDGAIEERMPCGACRQWLAELAPEALYYVDGVEGALQLPDLLPQPFSLRHNAKNRLDHETQ